MFFFLCMGYLTQDGFHPFVSLVEQNLKNFNFTAQWAYTTCRFWCFLSLLGTKVSNPIARGSRQPSFV